MEMMMEMMMETMKANSQMVFQVGEMLKELNIARQIEGERNNRGGYQRLRVGFFD